MQKNLKALIDENDDLYITIAGLQNDQDDDISAQLQNYISEIKEQVIRTIDDLKGDIDHDSDLLKKTFVDDPMGQVSEVIGPG